MRLAIAALLLVACDGGADGGLSAALYVPSNDLELVYVPTDDPYGELRALEPIDGQWELRDGYDEPSDDWADGTVVDDFDVASDDGLRVDDTLFLPKFFATGTKEEGAEVTAVGETEVYYGTFDNAATVELADGRWAGTQILATGFGPVRFTLDGASWDLVSYTH